MLPVLVLDVKPGERVLDMCASPGSKTVQLLEAVAAKDVCQGPLDPGLVVANDAGLGERVPFLERVLATRPGTERAHLVITSALGERLPRRTEGLPAFDRVLVDAPCSGDGTIRKAADVLRRWSPDAALELHAVQVSLVVHGLQMLRDGGTLVYSTCSLNPIEDEAVVAAVLREGALEGGVRAELVDVSAKLGHLKVRPGLEEWRVCHAQSTSLQWHVEEASAREHGMRAAVSSMWPPSPQEREWMHLQRCRRLLPHDLDTGGFFLAAFVRIGEAKLEEKPKAAAVARPAVLQPRSHPWHVAPDTLRAELLGRCHLQVCGEALSNRFFVHESLEQKSSIIVAPAELQAMCQGGWPVISAGVRACHVERRRWQWLPDGLDLMRVCAAQHPPGAGRLMTAKRKLTAEMGSDQVVCEKKAKRKLTPVIEEGRVARAKKKKNGSRVKRGKVSCPDIPSAKCEPSVQ